MENIDTQTIVNKDAVNLIAASYIMLAFTFILVFNTVETDFSMLIGAIGLIIFLTQAKHIKSEIRMFVYAGIIIYIIAFFMSIFYVLVTVSTAANAIVSHSHGNEFSGEYFVKYFYNNYFIFSIILLVIYTITYILISYKFFLRGKFLFIAGIVTSGVLELIYTIMNFINMKAIIGSENIKYSDIGALESSIKYAGNSGYPLMIKIAAVILYAGLFIYLGIYISKHPNNYIEKTEPPEI